MRAISYAPPKSAGADEGTEMFGSLSHQLRLKERGGRGQRNIIDSAKQ
jgi:hypothetical protein